jgi:hypothetical protein
MIAAGLLAAQNDAQRQRVATVAPEQGGKNRGEGDMATWQRGKARALLMAAHKTSRGTPGVRPHESSLRALQSIT